MLITQGSDSKALLHLASLCCLVCGDEGCYSPSFPSTVGDECSCSHYWLLSGCFLLVVLCITIIRASNCMAFGSKPRRAEHGVVLGVFFLLFFVGNKEELLLLEMLSRPPNQ